MAEGHRAFVDFNSRHAPELCAAWRELIFCLQPVGEVPQGIFSMDCGGGRGSCERVCGERVGADREHGPKWWVGGTRVPQGREKRKKFGEERTLN